MPLGSWTEGLVSSIWSVKKICQKELALKQKNEDFSNPQPHNKAA